MTVSGERRAALRGFFEDSQRGQNGGVTFVEVGDILGVLDDLERAEERLKTCDENYWARTRQFEALQQEVYTLSARLLAARAGLEQFAEWAHWGRISWEDRNQPIRYIWLVDDEPWRTATHALADSAASKATESGADSSTAAEVG